MTRIDRRALFTSGAAAALLAASGVSAEPRRGGRLKAALAGGTGFRDAVATCLCEGLTEVAADGTLHAEIAMRWESDVAARVWHFDLRETVFHDGLALAEADLIASLGQLGMVTVTGGRLEIILNVADASLPYRLAGPDFLIRPADTTRRENLIGSGIYRVRKHDAGRHFIADRVAKHWKDGQAGWFDTVEYAQFSSDAVRAQALREGLVDVADIAELDEYSDPKDFTLLPAASKTTQIVSRRVALPAKIGSVFPLDNLRMAERWWIV